jgi:hypothetical protein
MRAEASLDATFENQDAELIRKEPAQERPDALTKKKAPGESATRIASLLQ